jgi:hypothetical protein
VDDSGSVSRFLTSGDYATVKDGSDLDDTFVSESTKDALLELIGQTSMSVRSAYYNRRKIVNFTGQACAAVADKTRKAVNFTGQACAAVADNGRKVVNITGEACAAVADGGRRVYDNRVKVAKVGGVVVGTSAAASGLGALAVACPAVGFPLIGITALATGGATFTGVLSEAEKTAFYEKCVLRPADGAGSNAKEGGNGVGVQLPTAESRSTPVGVVASLEELQGKLATPANRPQGVGAGGD